MRIRDIGKWVEAFLTPLIGVLAVPVRQLHLQIGHATVTAWLLVGLCWLGSVYMWAEYLHNLEVESYAANARLRDAQARAAELSNAEKEGRSTSATTIRLVATRVTNDGVTIEMAKMDELESVIVKWDSSASRPRPEPGSPLPAVPPPISGIEAYAVDPANTSPIYQLTIPASTFGAGWVTNRRLSFQIEQRGAGGRRQRSAGSSWGTIP